MNLDAPHPLPATPQHAFTASPVNWRSRSTVGDTFSTRILQTLSNAKKRRSPRRAQSVRGPASGAPQRRGPIVRLLRQSVGFSMVGLLQLLLDWGVMVGLSALGAPMAPSNILGRLAGAALGFWGNGRVTFAGSQLPLWRSACRFVLLWCALTLLSTYALEEVAIHHSLDVAWLSKPLIEGALSLISFFVCRHWVFGRRDD